MIRHRNKIGAVLLIGCILGAGFFIGQALGLQIEDFQVKRYYEPLTETYNLDTEMSSEAWRETINRLIAAGMECVSMESELHFADSKSSCQARISSSEDNELGVKLMLVRSATNEILYESELIDPGHYIETIQLESELEAGHYPCTAIWEFYSSEDDFFVGNSARNVVVTVSQ